MSIPKFKLVIEPRKVISWPEFIRKAEPSIALDGYVSGEPLVNPPTHYNFNHHERVNRLATRCTAAQIHMALKMGFLDELPNETINVYVNDCDQDVCLSWWLLTNYERVCGEKSEPMISRLLFNVDVQDTCAGAYPISQNSRMSEEMAWIFAPYTASRHNQTIATMDASTMESCIEAVNSRITAYSMGMGHRQELETDYEILVKGKEWSVLKEIGLDARTAIRTSGLTRFASLKSDKNGTYHYSLVKLSPFDSNTDLDTLYVRLNEAEKLDAKVGWGGSDLVGGSPRALGSKLPPEELARILNS